MKTLRSKDPEVNERDRVRRMMAKRAERARRRAAKGLAPIDRNIVYIDRVVIERLARVEYERPVCRVAR